MDKKDLLNSVTVAKFIRDGYLRYDEVVSKELCQEAKKAILSGELNAYDHVGSPFSSIWNNSTMGKIYRLTKVKGIIESLLGPDPQYDHHYIHTNKAHTKGKASLHQDGDYDTRNYGFDLLILFYPEDVTENMGGTLLIPGSHFRKINSNIIKRYQHIVGQQQLICKAGTILFIHSNLWHSGRSNHSGKDRLLFKVRLNPAVKQVRTWNTDDIDTAAIQPILSDSIAWHGEHQRLEIINTVRLWRYMTGDSTSEFKTKKLWGTKLADIPKVIYQDSLRSMDMTDETV